MIPAHPPRRLLSLAALLTLALPASATWSIVAVNARTGEVAVGTATCLLGLNMRESVPVIVVGKGAAAAQSLLDLSAVNRTKIYDALVAGQTPGQALAIVAQSPSHQQKQYGIAAFSGPPVTFTGNGAGAAASGVVGSVGDYHYAIQGNLLTGDEVVLAAEAAFVSTSGDMGQRLMASMQAARAFGGDGRCSCSQNQPTSCGAPPVSFTKSAHIGTMIVSRIGDEEKPCNATKGCARGTYYMTLNVVATSAGEPDPVDQLQQRFDGWRSKKLLRPDAVLSTVESVESLPADGVTTRTVTVRLANVDGQFFTTGGATVTVSTLDGLPSLLGVGPVQDLGDGRYTFELTAGTQSGTDTFVITAFNGGLKTTTLYPYLSVRSDPPAPLHAGRSQVAASAPSPVPLRLELPGSAGEPYLLLASLNGTQPGTVVREVLLPLNAPLIASPGGASGEVDERLIRNAAGTLDAAGRAEAVFHAGAPRLASLVGRRIDFAAVARSASGPAVTNAVGFTIVP